MPLGGKKPGGLLRRHKRSLFLPRAQMDLKRFLAEAHQAQEAQRQHAALILGPPPAPPGSYAPAHHFRTYQALVQPPRWAQSNGHSSPALLEPPEGHKPFSLSQVSTR